MNKDKMKEFLEDNWEVCAIVAVIALVFMLAIFMPLDVFLVAVSALACLFMGVFSLYCGIRETIKYGFDMDVIIPIGVGIMLLLIVIYTVKSGVLI